MVNIYFYWNCTYSAGGADAWDYADIPGAYDNWFESYNLYTTLEELTAALEDGSNPAWPAETLPEAATVSYNVHIIMFGEIHPSTRPAEAFTCCGWDSSKMVISDNYIITPNIFSTAPTGTYTIGCSQKLRGSDADQTDSVGESDALWVFKGNSENQAVLASYNSVYYESATVGTFTGTNASMESAEITGGSLFVHIKNADDTNQPFTFDANNPPAIVFVYSGEPYITLFNGKIYLMNSDAEYDTGGVIDTLTAPYKLLALEDVNFAQATLDYLPQTPITPAPADVRASTKFNGDTQTGELEVTVNSGGGGYGVLNIG